MFKKISSGMQFPLWATEGSRWRRLDVLDKLLDGKFYDHLKHCYYDEQQNSREIPLAERRPSVQFRAIRMVARWSGRKLFSGRHVPKIHHPDEAAQKVAHDLVVKSRLYTKMMETVLRGAIGSVAMTFKIDQKAGQEPKVGLKVWRSRDCDPQFDDMGTLVKLRVRYITTGVALAAIGLPVEDKNCNYWFIRDYLSDREVTYKPLEDYIWNPVQGFVGEEKPYRDPDPHETIVHNLGFVPGEWFRNLAGGDEIDGMSTFEDAIPPSIELDYLLSQVSRGTRYNCAPQVVVIGELRGAVDENGQPIRSPMNYLQVDAGMKEEGGGTTGRGDAKLLEMTGKGVESSLKLVERLHDFLLEVISAPRKDPQRVKGVLSGHAMENLDSDSHDLVMELRSSYGDYGMLPLLRKMIAAMGKYTPEMNVDVEKYALLWPRLNTPTADDIARIMEAMGNALNPLKIQFKPDESGKLPPAPEEYMALTPEQVRRYVASLLDIALLDAEGESAEEIEQPDGDDPPPEPAANPGGETDDNKDPTQVPPGEILDAVNVGGR